MITVRLLIILLLLYAIFGLAKKANSTPTLEHLHGGCFAYPRLHSGVLKKFLKLDCGFLRMFHGQKRDATVVHC